jgi:hypothetical protein
MSTNLQMRPLWQLTCALGIIYARVDLGTCTKETNQWYIAESPLIALSEGGNTNLLQAVGLAIHARRFNVTILKHEHERSNIEPFQYERT